MELGTFATGILTGFGASALLAVLLRRFLEEGIKNWFRTIQQARGIVGEAEIRYREQQLSEFYGPLYAYMQGSQPIYDLWMNGKLRHVNEPIKVKFREQNECMLNIIRTKAHLIDEGVFPNELARFMTSVTIWNLYTSQQDGLPQEVAELPAASFPVEFQKYIYEKTEELKAELEGLYKKYGVK
ncbi:MAG: hypothetical protein JSW66_06960 [Phycisphaerales bacterium]|nr:MAG: hypothetical protein JSW66_06960 [Phycisphaerales bacterium]